MWSNASALGQQWGIKSDFSLALTEHKLVSSNKNWGGEVVGQGKGEEWGNAHATEKSKIGLSDWENKNTGYPVKFEF